MRRIAAIVFGSAFLAGSALAQPRVVPWTDTAPAVSGTDVEAAALGTPDLRTVTFRARRASARRTGEARAIERLHQHVDETLTRVLVSPAVAEAAHDVVQNEARVVAVRALVDGSAVLVVAVPRASLQAVVEVEQGW